MSKLKKLDLDELAAKIVWEGGISDAIEYGIQARDIADLEVAKAWLELTKAYNKVDKLLSEYIEEHSC